MTHRVTIVPAGSLWRWVCRCGDSQWKPDLKHKATRMGRLHINRIMSASGGLFDTATDNVDRIIGLSDDYLSQPI